MRAVALAVVLGALPCAVAQPVVADSTAEVSASTPEARSSRAAAVRSLLLPGLGQVYNRQPAKAPIAAGLVVAAAVYAVDRQRRYVTFRRATVFAGCQDSPDRDVCAEAVPDYRDEWEALGSATFAQLRPVRERARGQRDVGVLVVAVAYAFQALEAFVAAELSDFDVSEDLSVALEAEPRRPGLSVRVRL